MCTCEATASSSCSSRVMPHSDAVLAACSPIESPVRGSAFCGISGTICPGRSRVSVRARPGSDFARLRSSRMCRRSSLTAIGASEAVSTPPAIPTSICPSAILLATVMTVSRPVPQACWRS